MLETFFSADFWLPTHASHWFAYFAIVCILIKAVCGKDEAASSDANNSNHQSSMVIGVKKVNESNVVQGDFSNNKENDLTDATCLHQENDDDDEDDEDDEDDDDSFYYDETDDMLQRQINTVIGIYNIHNALMLKFQPMVTAQQLEELFVNFTACLKIKDPVYDLHGDDYIAQQCRDWETLQRQYLFIRKRLVKELMPAINNAQAQSLSVSIYEMLRVVEINIMDNLGCAEGYEDKLDVEYILKNELKKLGVLDEEDVTDEATESSEHSDNRDSGQEHDPSENENNADDKANESDDKGEQQKKSSELADDVKSPDDE